MTGNTEKYTSNRICRLCGIAETNYALGPFDNGEKVYMLESLAVIPAEVPKIDYPRYQMFKEHKRLIYLISRRRDIKHEIVFFSCKRNSLGFSSGKSRLQPLGRATAEPWNYIRYRLIDIHILKFATSFLKRAYDLGQRSVQPRK